MVPLIRQAANTSQLSVHLENSVGCSGCSVSHGFTGSTVVETGIAMQLCKLVHQMLPTSCRYTLSATLQIIPPTKPCGLDVIGKWAVS